MPRYENGLIPINKRATKTLVWLLFARSRYGMTKCTIDELHIKNLSMIRQIKLQYKLKQNAIPHMNVLFTN